MSQAGIGVNLKELTKNRIIQIKVCLIVYRQMKQQVFPYYVHGRVHLNTV